MQIFGICVTKNEDDILKHVIQKGLTWCDQIFVINNAVQDATSQIVEQLHRETGRVHLVAEHAGSFHNGLRSLPFNKFKKNAIKGRDWWCRLDSDEIYLDNPRLFLRNIPKLYNSVYSENCQYYFTTEDLETYKDRPDLYRNGFAIQNLHYFLCNHSELRFIRHGDYDWEDGAGWPDQRKLFPIFPINIRLAHYRYRYPEQIQERLDSRLAVPTGSFRHEKFFEKMHEFSSKVKHPVDDWRSRVFSPEDFFDDRKMPVCAAKLETASYRPRKMRQIVDLIKLNLGWL